MNRGSSGAPEFKDVEDVAPGTQFDAELDEQMSASTIVLVLIGPAWVSELRQRLEQTDIDYVRAEVATALAKRKRVIPVLLKGAALPRVGDLPEDLRRLVKHQSMTLRDECWRQDVNRLIDAIGRPYRWRIVALRAVVALVVIVVGVKLLVPWLPDDRANDVVFLRMLIGSLACLYAVVEIVVEDRYRRNRSGSGPCPGESPPALPGKP